MLTGQRGGTFGTEFALALMVMLSTISFAALIWWSCGWLARLDNEQRQAEAEVKRSEIQLAEAQRIAHMGSAEWDLKTDAVTWSDELFRILGLDPQGTQPSYELFLERVHPGERELVQQSIADSQRTGEPFAFDYRIVRPDGTLRILHGEGNVSMNGSGAPVRLTSTAQDITERKQIEYALRKSEERTRSLIDSAHDAFVAIDEAGIITDWNPQAEATFGWSREEAVGQRLAETIIPPEYGEAHKRGLKHFLASGEGPALNKRLELAAMHRDGHQFPVELTISPIRLPHGYVFSAFVRDITERKQSEAALARQTDELTRINAELEDFTHSVSHDLKEPLRGIEAFAGFLAEDCSDRLDEQGQRYVNILRESAVRMKDLIDDLLQLSRIGRTPMDYIPIRTLAMVEDIKLELQFAIQEKNVDLRIDPELPTVTYDKTRMRQLFENLISNAIKYNDKPQPMIEIACRQDGDVYTFSVRDNGIGIEEQYHEKIFRIFQRLHAREEYEGTGVGLTMCKKIVEAHGGKIWVESSPGQGTAFLFTIPKRPDAARKEHQIGQPALPH